MCRDFLYVSDVAKIRESHLRCWIRVLFMYITIATSLLPPPPRHPFPISENEDTFASQNSVCARATFVVETKCSVQDYHKRYECPKK